jgi:hypothetical protein
MAMMPMSATQMARRPVMTSNLMATMRSMTQRRSGVAGSHRGAMNPVRRHLRPLSQGMAPVMMNARLSRQSRNA